MARNRFVKRYRPILFCQANIEPPQLSNSSRNTDCSTSSKSIRTDLDGPFRWTTRADLGFLRDTGQTERKDVKPQRLRARRSTRAAPFFPSKGLMVRDGCRPPDFLYTCIMPAQFTAKVIYHLSINSPNSPKACILHCFTDGISGHRQYYIQPTFRANETNKA